MATELVGNYWKDIKQTPPCAACVDVYFNYAENVYENVIHDFLLKWSCPVYIYFQMVWDIR